LNDRRQEIFLLIVIMKNISAAMDFFIFEMKKWCQIMGEYFGDLKK